MESNLSDTGPGTGEFTLDFLKRITNKFFEKHIVGRGGFGRVYKGVLDNGEEIALKKFNDSTGLDDKNFLDEYNNIVKAKHHRNIVEFIGYCYHPGRHQRTKRDNGTYVFAVDPPETVLCFEYLQGGSLDKHISGMTICFKIIKGVCQGLNYLHNGNEESIYHLDLKPENILLDNNMMPKIGDLGISRIVSSQGTCTTATRMMGTMGFMPPEYINKQEISQKYDVFSLGVIIMQIMAGRKLKGDYNCGSIPSDKFIELVCEKWGERLDEKIWSHTSPQVKTCIQIAVKCVEDDRQKRPTISKIIDELNTRLTLKHCHLQSRLSTYKAGGPWPIINPRTQLRTGSMIAATGLIPLPIPWIVNRSS